MYQEFKKQFNLPSNGFLSPVDFTDGNFGFSTLKKYSNSYVSQFNIFISTEEMGNGKPLKPLTVTVSYGKETERGIVFYSSAEKIKGIFDPIDLISTNEFFYNIKTQEFFYNKNKIEAPKILEIIDKLHKKPARPMVGLWLRIRLIFWRVIITSLVEFFSNIFVRLLYVSSGAKVPKDIFKRIVFADHAYEETEQSDRIIKEKRIIKFFGYMASLWAVNFYCCLHISLYLLFYFFNFKPILLEAIFKNTFLTIIYVIPSLSFIDIMLPKILKFMVRKTDLLFHNLSSRRMKI